MTLGRPGDLLADRYRLDRFIGGAGSVERWLAYDERLARPVTARLEPAPGSAADQDESTAAAQAALTRLAQLNHPGVAAVYDVGTAEGLRDGAVSYAISEWTEGRTLGQIMATGLQPWQRTADWGRQISGALAALHAIGIEHGALSPQSVAIHDDRQVKILDVGLDSAAAEEDGGAEGAEGELPAGAPDDMYTLGFLLWEATVGAPPEYVIPGSEPTEDPAGAPEKGDSATGDAATDDSATEDAATEDADSAPTEPVEPVSETSAPVAAGIDLRPLLEVGAAAGFAALLAQMLAGDAASRPTAAEAEQRFAPFAVAERAGDTLPSIAAVSDKTQVLGPPIVGGVSAAAVAGAKKAERDRRRGAMLGLALLVAAALAGLGLLLANLNSHSANPNVVDTVVPSSSPGMVTLPNGSLSPAPTNTPTGGGHATGGAPSTPAGSSATAQESASPSASPSAPASSTAAPSSGASAPSVGGGASTPSPPGGVGGGGGGTASPTASSHILPQGSRAATSTSP